MPERLLGLLVNIYDDDPRIGLHAPAILKTQIQTAEFQPRNEIEKRHRPLTNEGNVINRQRRHRDNGAEDQRALVQPPLLQEPRTFWCAEFGGGSHERHTVVKSQKPEVAQD